MPNWLGWKTAPEIVNISFAEFRKFVKCDVIKTKQNAITIETSFSPAVFEL